MGQRNESWRPGVTNGSHQRENGTWGTDGPVENFWPEKENYYKQKELGSIIGLF
jgi:hypothetical protein